MIFWAFFQNYSSDHHPQAYNGDVFTVSPVDEASLPLTQSAAQKLFRNLHEPCSHDEINERRAVIQFLHKILISKIAEVVFPGSANWSPGDA
jgi:hypothetical protein